MSHTFTPSAESLAVFDSIKNEVDAKRSHALASLRAVNSSSNEGDVCPLSTLTVSSWWHALSPLQQANGIADQGEKRANRISPAKHVDTFDEVKIVTWSWFGAQAFHEPTSTGSGRDVPQNDTCHISNGKATSNPLAKHIAVTPKPSKPFIPSAESVAVFDELMGEVHQKRSKAFASLKARSFNNPSDASPRSWFAALPPRAPAVNEQGKPLTWAQTGLPPIAPLAQSFRARSSTSGTPTTDSRDVVFSAQSSLRSQQQNTPLTEISGTTLQTVRQKRPSYVAFSDASAAARPRKPMKPQQPSNKTAAAGIKDLGLEMGFSERGTHTEADKRWLKAVHGLRTCRKPFGPLTEKEMSARKWCEQVREHHKKLRGEAPHNWELWNRSHIPHQLRASKPSPVSGAWHGWELNKDLVHRVRAQVRTVPPTRECAPKPFWICVSDGIAKVLSAVGDKLGALWKMVSGTAARGLSKVGSCGLSMMKLLRIV